MSDFDRELMLLEAVHEFRTEASPYVHPAGTRAVRATVRRRRQVRIVALAAVIVVLVLAPVAAFAALGGGRHQPQPAASPSASVTDSPTAPASPSSIPPPPADLSNAALTLGPWSDSPDNPQPCPTGKVTFAANTAQLPGKAPVYLLEHAPVDVDHDGTDEVAIVIRCANGQAGTNQAIAVKAAPDGTLTTMGEIARSSADANDIRTVAPGDNGRVNLTVGDIIPCCGTPQSLELTQVRTFAWNGSAFTQVAGPTTFVADRSAVDLTVSAPTVHFRRTSGTHSAGTLSVTIHNTGPRAAQQVSLLVWTDAPLAPGAGGDWAKCANADGSYPAPLCQVGDLAVGATVTLTLPLVSLSGGGGPVITLQPRIGDLKYDSLHIASDSA
jgi:hypothetical protein